MPATPETLAPEDDFAHVVSSLARNRAQALTSRSRGRLGLVDAPGSPAHRQDLALLDRLERAGLRLAGLRFDVVQVQVVRRDADQVVLRARVSTSAHRLVSSGGADVAVAATRPRRLLLVLVRSSPDAPWRLRSAQA